MFWNYKAFTEKGATFWEKVNVTQIVPSLKNMTLKLYCNSLFVYSLLSLQTIYGCQLSTVDDAGHMVMVECPDKVNSLIHTFVMKDMMMTHRQPASPPTTRDVTETDDQDQSSNAITVEDCWHLGKKWKDYTLSHCENDRDVSAYSRGRCLISRVLHMCVISRVQNRIPGLTHKWWVLQSISFGAPSDVTAVLEMRQSIQGYILRLGIVSASSILRLGIFWQKVVLNRVQQVNLAHTQQQRVCVLCAYKLRLCAYYVTARSIAIIQFITVIWSRPKILLSASSLGRVLAII